MKWNRINPTTIMAEYKLYENKVTMFFNEFLEFYMEMN